ncbi:MAG: hypothetical protein PF442_07875 [Desulfobulbaceae bacterium]|jgi:hypothetical protein|nr:hypothetical protein [Desulfobulbaceae bacterium]
MKQELSEVEKSTGFDLQGMVLPANKLDAGGTVEVLAHVPIRKPKKNEFFRCHPDHTLAPVGIVEDDIDRSEYLVSSPDIFQTISDLATMRALHLCISRHGSIFLWPRKLPGERAMAWHSTAEKAAELATTEWVNMRADTGAGMYRLMHPTAKLPEPNWPDKSFTEIVKMAFEGRIISSESHCLVRRLLGQE